MSLDAQQQFIEDLLNSVKAKNDDAIDIAVKKVKDNNLEETAVSKIGPLLTDITQDQSIRLIVIFVLNDLEDVSATPFLGETLVNTNNNLDIRNASLGSLEAIDPTGGLIYFRQLLSDPDSEIRSKGEVSFNYSLKQITQLEPILAKTILANAQISVSDLIPFLSKDVIGWEPGTTLVPATAAETLGILQDPNAIEPLNQAIQRIQQKQEQASADEHEVSQSPYDGIMTSIVAALQSIGSPNNFVLSDQQISDIVGSLADVLDNNLTSQVRSYAASSLGYLGYMQVITPLSKSLLFDSNRGVKTKVQQALERIPDWQEKSNRTIKLISDGPLQREQIDAQLVISAIKPPDSELDNDPNIFVDYLIETAVKYHDNSRVLRILSTFIILTTNNNTDLINQRFDFFHKEKNINEKILQELRKEIGGATLKPLLKQLEENLEKYFQQPLEELNKDTRKVWKTTITLANTGFIIRILMSVTLFAIGAYLVLDSYQLFSDGNLNIEQAFGPGTSFFTGIGIIVATFIKFPLKEIKRAVSDVGLANVAFISYVHRVLQVSHTFSYHYLNDDISFSQLKKAGEIIEDTSSETILILEMAGSTTVEQNQQFINILLKKLEANPDTQTQSGNDST